MPQVIDLTKEQERTKQQDGRTKEAEFKAHAAQYAIVSPGACAPSGPCPDNMTPHWEPWRSACSPGTALTEVQRLLCRTGLQGSTETH